jgi:hypothetical protein
MADLPVNAKALRAALKELASEVLTSETDNDGNVVALTRADALARLLWNRALGYTESYRDEAGRLCKKVHDPESWAMQYVFERIEGRAPQATVEAEAGVKAVDKVRELAKDRLNRIAATIAGPPKLK